MITNKISKIAYVVAVLIAAYTQFANANVVINNNTNPPSDSQPQQPACSGDMGTSTDPRVPPAGVYTSRNSDGSSNTLYTTGDKKPYYVDNPCNNNAAVNTPQQPQVIVQPTMPTTRR
ncbi:MAG: hypothetical protein P4M14_00850 [Gammaproteobacteria bacterium]|nr:hypothetical protein [Gammaproteobacteria bacterium]